MTHRNALLAIHFGALMFGLSGVFGKLAESTPLVITFGRALFAVIALLLAALTIILTFMAQLYLQGTLLIIITLAVHVVIISFRGIFAEMMKAKLKADLPT